MARSTLHAEPGSPSPRAAAAAGPNPDRSAAPRPGEPTVLTSGAEGRGGESCRGFWVDWFRSVTFRGFPVSVVLDTLRRVLAERWVSVGHGDRSMDGYPRSPTVCGSEQKPTQPPYEGERN